MRLALLAVQLLFSCHKYSVPPSDWACQLDGQHRLGGENKGTSGGTGPFGEATSYDLYP
ncbi:hypothetical protein OCEANICA350_12156 [Oceanicaulis sp. 350]|nr:hypothetical protein OCEANICA350_12156 [Oceanicaulis sp. 350]